MELTKKQEIMQTYKEILQSIKRIKKGIQNIDSVGEGVYYYHVEDKEVEDLAIKRKNICINCEYFEEDILNVKDNRIPELTNKMCGLCLCVLPYKLRTKNIEKIENCKLNDLH